MEDWDLADHGKFPHLAMDKYMRRVYYEEIGVTTLETDEWVWGGEQSWLVNLLWVPHYHHTPINMICVCHLLTLVYNGFLWLRVPIPITYMVIHRIMHLSYKGGNLAKEFGGKNREKDITKRMKRDYNLLKKLWAYSIISVTDPTVQLVAQILAGKVKRKCRVDEVSMPIVSLFAQCMKGIQFNWAWYPYQEFLANCWAAQDETKWFHYAWLLLSIVLVAWELLKASQIPSLKEGLLEVAQFASLSSIKDVGRITKMKIFWVLMEMNLYMAINQHPRLSPTLFMHLSAYVAFKADFHKVYIQV